MCTWNVKVTQPPDEDFRSLLHLDNEEQLPDIVAVGYVFSHLNKEVFFILTVLVLLDLYAMISLYFMYLIHATLFISIVSKR